MIICQTRGDGKTWRAVQSCIAARGIYVCHSQCFAEQLMDQYTGLDAISVEQDWMMCCAQRPLFFDHLVTENALNDNWALKEKLHASSGKLQKMTEERDNYKVRLGLAVERADRLQKKIEEMIRRGKMLRDLEDILNGP